jgi:hypothetical protein
MGVEEVFSTEVFEGNVWGLEWQTRNISPRGVVPQYFKHVGDHRVAVSAAIVPADTGLLSKEFRLAKPGKPYTSPTDGAWSNPGPTRGPFTVRLTDGSLVAYSWYRFVDQPSFQQYSWSEAKQSRLQSFIEELHKAWSIDQDYMAPPSSGTLAALDPALFVSPPKGLEVGYVPIVTRQEMAVELTC